MPPWFVVDEIIAILCEVYKRPTYVCFADWITQLFRIVHLDYAFTIEGSFVEVNSGICVR